MVWNDVSFWVCLLLLIIIVYKWIYVNGIFIKELNFIFIWLSFNGKKNFNNFDKCMFFFFVFWLLKYEYCFLVFVLWNKVFKELCEFKLKCEDLM